MKNSKIWEVLYKQSSAKIIWKSWNLGGWVGLSNACRRCQAPYASVFKDIHMSCMCISEHIHAQRHISIYFPWDYSSPGTDTNFHHFIKQSRGSLPRYTFQREPTFVASHSLNITYNSVYNQCCTVCGCPEGASTQNIVCHYVRLGCRLGTIAWKKCYFQKQSFPTQQRHIQAISCVFCLRDFRCEGICHGSQRCIKQQRQTSSQAETTNFLTFAILLSAMVCLHVLKIPY